MQPPKVLRRLSQAIVFSVSLLTYALPSEAQQPAAQAKPHHVTVSVDWNRSLRSVDARSYGVNCPACFDPAWSHNASFLRALSTVTAGAKPLIRLHGWGMVTQGSNECWLNRDGRWNSDKIKDALTPLVAAGYKLMIDIPSGPGGDHNVKEMRDSAAMAGFAAALVRIVNVENQFGVKYWELPNEQEHTLRATEMATLLSEASAAMKKVDPTIFVGGPAADHIDPDYIAEVVKQSLANIDFISVHTYGGDGKESDEVAFANAQETITNLHTLRQRLTEVSQGKYLPIFVDEYNIGYDPTPRIRNNVGAVYFSLIQGGVNDAGADVSAVWDCSAPHNMSIVKRDGTLYPSAHLFNLMNRYFYGNQMATSSSDPLALYAYAVHGSATHSLLLSNLSSSSRVVDVRFEGWQPHKAIKEQVASTGYSGPFQIKWVQATSTQITIPPKSVTVLVAR